VARILLALSRKNYNCSLEQCIRIIIMQVQACIQMFEQICVWIVYTIDAFLKFIFFLILLNFERASANPNIFEVMITYSMAYAYT
jgi:hypothetical protein